MAYLCLGAINFCDSAPIKGITTCIAIVIFVLAQGGTEMVKIFFSILWGFADLILLIGLIPVIVLLIVMLVDLIKGYMGKSRQDGKRREEKEEK